MNARADFAGVWFVGLAGLSLFFAPLAVEAQIVPGPVISGLSDVRMLEETTTTMSFTVTDADGLVTNVSASIPANPDLAKISSTLNGSNVTMTIVGNFNQFGTNSVEVVASDNHGFSATNHFVLEVWYNSPPPHLLGPNFISQQNVRAGDVFFLSFPVYGVGTTVQADSDNQKLISDANILIQQTGTDLYTLTAFPAGVLSGSANITITATDSVTAQSVTFNVFVDAPGNPLFASPDPITIIANQTATPYPATNSVSGLLGSVEHLTVTLFGISMAISSNAAVLLVGPSGASVVLMAGAGSTNALASTTLVFDDSATNTLSSTRQIISGTYRPAGYGSTHTLPSPAPGQPYGTNLAVFKGTNPNGTWQLFVYDGGSLKPGIISQGWQLSIQTRPNILPIPVQQTDENTPIQVSVTIGDNQPGVNMIVTATADSVLFQPITVSGSGATRTLSITPQPYQYGTNSITVTATDPDNNTATAPFQMGVRFVPLNPGQSAAMLINQTGNALGVRFVGVTNAAYTLQSSVNLWTWIDLGALATGPDGSASFQIQLSGSTTNQFFRVVAR